MAARTHRVMCRLACRDYLREALLSACAVLGLAAVLTPLLVLYGVKFGVVQTLTDRLQHDPRNLEVSPVSSGRFTLRMWKNSPHGLTWPLLCPAPAPSPRPWTCATARKARAKP